jgi:hypothetical protein
VNEFACKNIVAAFDHIGACYSSDAANQMERRFSPFEKDKNKRSNLSQGRDVHKKVVIGQTMCNWSFWNARKELRSLPT